LLGLELLDIREELATVGRFNRIGAWMAVTASNVFYPSLNDFCRKYLVVGPTPLSRSDELQFAARDAAERASLFEHLLLFDTVSIKVYGENVPLALMLRLFGEKGLEALIEQKAIRFVLWTR
jgi:hypothetical protein